jgi:hypothetical protein
VRILLGIVFGAALGFGWHKVVGCRTGSCPITANPWTSMAYGAGIGALWGGAFG